MKYLVERVNKVEMGMKEDSVYSLKVESGKDSHEEQLGKARDIQMVLFP